jgi:hypothetical protein
MRKASIIAVILLSLSSVAFGECLLTLQTESLPLFVIGQPSNFQIEAVSGTEPYRFEVTEGTFPDGLHLTKNGKITGVAREEADVVVYITVTDAAGCQLTTAFAVRSGPLP